VAFTLKHQKSDLGDVSLESLKSLKYNLEDLNFFLSQTGDPAKDRELCLKIVQKNILKLRFVKTQTLEICSAAVKKDGDNLEFSKFQTEKMCLDSVRSCGLNLKFVKNKTMKICYAAIKQNARAIKYIDQ
jgi:hypothetical protein